MTTQTSSAPILTTHAAPATIAAPKAKRVRKAKTTPTAPAVVKADGLASYAATGVYGMAALSAILNGYSHAEHAPMAWAGWMMGAAVPAIILILGKVAGLLAKRHINGAKGRFARYYGLLAIIAASAGLCMLLLSIWHCSVSIAALTGSPIALAIPMAIAIDVGFSVCEVALLAD